jgi:EAL domain-containing protein (putative c-di-GMP-specific phosphodiesterase class I)
MQVWQVVNPETAPQRVNVNVSGRQFRNVMLAQEVAEILRETGLPPERLELEITETVMMQDAEVTSRTLGDLKKLGVHLAIDDFGTGYSSLSSLKRLPIDTLKIDRSFVSGLGQDPEDHAIVLAIISLARTLGISVVGEGIETALQRAQLEALGCDRGQGYLFARPLNVNDFNAGVIGYGLRNAA